MTANTSPAWIKTDRASRASLVGGKPNSAASTIEWPSDDTGKNSVMPRMMPRMIEAISCIEPKPRVECHITTRYTIILDFARSQRKSENRVKYENVVNL